MISSMASSVEFHGGLTEKPTRELTHVRSDESQ